MAIGEETRRAQRRRHMKMPTAGMHPEIGAQFDVSHFANKANGPPGQERNRDRNRDRNRGFRQLFLVA
jgi:hypothetical protein